MLSEPKIVHRAAQPYVAIKESVTIPFGDVIDRSYPEVFGWLGARGVPPAGPPFIKYNVIDMERELEIEMGVLLASAVAGDERVQAGVLPAGRYATLTYTGPWDGEGLVGATAALLKWADEKNMTFKMAGETWVGRFEIYHTDPREEPDPSKYETEITFLLADG